MTLLFSAEAEVEAEEALTASAHLTKFFRKAVEAAGVARVAAAS